MEETRKQLTCDIIAIFAEKADIPQAYTSLKLNSFGFDEHLTKIIESL